MITPANRHPAPALRPEHAAGNPYPIIGCGAEHSLRSKLCETLRAGTALPRSPQRSDRNLPLSAAPLADARVRWPRGLTLAVRGTARSGVRRAGDRQGYGGAGRADRVADARVRASGQGSNAKSHRRETGAKVDHQRGGGRGGPSVARRGRWSRRWETGTDRSEAMMEELESPLVGNHWYPAAGGWAEGPLARTGQISQFPRSGTLRIRHLGVAFYAPVQAWCMTEGQDA